MKSDLHMRAWAIERRFLRRLISRARAQKTDLAGALALIYPGDEESEEAGGGYDVISGVAVIQVTGVIWEGCPDLYKRLGYATDPTDVREAVRKAADDAAVRSIYLHVDSPGGYIDGVDELADAIYETRAVKPIHAHIANLGASAGYEIACNAHTITANRRATVGSIGTYLVIDDWSQFYQEAGVITHVVSSGPYKGTGVIGAEVTDEQLAWLQEEVNDLAEQFVATVARGRGMTIARATELATGRTWIAGQAVDLGLIDAVATEEEAFAAVIDEGPDTSEIQTGKEHGMGILAVLRGNSDKEKDMADRAKDVEAAEAAPDEEQSEAAEADETAEESDVESSTIDPDALESDLGAKAALDVLRGRRGAVEAYREALSAERVANEKLRAEITALQGENKDLRDKVLEGAQDVEHSPEPRPATFGELVDEYQREHDCSIAEAMRAVNEANPGLYEQLEDDEAD